MGKVKDMYSPILDELEPEAVKAQCSRCKQQQMLWSDETPDCLFCGRLGTVEALDTSEEQSEPQDLVDRLEFGGTDE